MSHLKDKTMLHSKANFILIFSHQAFQIYLLIPLTLMNLQGPLESKNELAPIALLFSGGLDSMILAALLDQCLDSGCKYDR